MATANGDTRLRGRKKVLLRARPNLVIVPRDEGGRRGFIAKDPVSLRYFDLTEAQRFLLERLDGQRTLEEVRQEFEEEFRPQRLTLEEVETFAGQLLREGLVEGVDGADGQRLFRQQRVHQQRERWARWSNVFYFKIPLLEPDRLLDRLRPVGQLLFSPVAVGAVALLVLAAIGLVATHWGDFVGRLPGYGEFFTWHNIVYVWLALGVVKICHELGHGLCCKYAGGRVRETGVALLLFFPTLYCDVTDAWMIRDKWKRMAVAAAGVYVELIVAAAATFAWWYSDPNTFWHNLSFGLVLVCGAYTVLVNANPLLRFDGYFVLSDLVEVPNLAALAAGQLRRDLLGWFGCDELCSGAAHPRPNLLRLYGAASLAYRCLLLAGFLYMTYLVFKQQHLQWLGLFIVALGVLSALAMPAYQGVRTLRQLGRLPEMRRGRLLWTLGLVAVLIVLVGFLPLPLRVRGTALVQVEPGARFTIVVPGPGGFLDELLVRDGQPVRRGDVLAVLRNPELLIAEQLVDADQGLRRQEQQAVALQLTAALPLLSPTGKSFGEIEHERLSLVRHKESLQLQRERLVLRAPADGVVLGLPSWEVRGKWLKEGLELCAVGDPQKLRALVLVEPADRQLVKPGSAAWFLSHGLGARVWAGLVTEAARVDADDIPPQLSSRAGGEVATQQDPEKKKEHPFQQHFLVAVRLPDADARLQAGTLGVVSVDAGSATLWWRARKFLGSTFGWGL